MTATPSSPTCHCRPNASPANACAHWPRSKGHPGTETPAALFLCTHNAGRSQTALGFFTALVADLDLTA